MDEFAERQRVDALSRDARSLRRSILSLAESRGADKTICPSEVARSLAGADETLWRRLMKPIRAEAVALALEGHVVIKRKGRPVDDPREFRGIYRIAIAPE